MRQVTMLMFFAMVFCYLINPLSSAAQSLGVIKGTVKDAETGSGLPGVKTS